jgi:Chalcone isomerase-like
MRYAYMRLCRLFALMVSVVCLMGAPALAATIEGMHFDDAVRLETSDLQLNGVGLRAVFVIKGYVAGLYLSTRAATSSAALAAPGPKRVQMRMLREAKAEDFKKALGAGMRKNSTEAELANLQDRINAFELAIESIGIVRKGDTITLDYVPVRGTTLAVNGSIKGHSISGADFYDKLLEIFVGDNPVDLWLKKGLLGL